MRPDHSLVGKPAISRAAVDRAMVATMSNTVLLEQPGQAHTFHLWYHWASHGDDFRQFS